ncbi:glycosyltransferase family 4 protein [Methanosarcina sp. KYL-1]|uniref:glycosyltransferase family 4 protein n=1 Tax=Methanosarcina sp. KYL-1 TaxID=2602068 RepID=UPI0021017C5B|nr:glycosyltransferase family 4 protein [Methanosarcina sp. KYL-1]MCQ1535190.1 glycosyltransferase family 4 protein [Methanosarcina sp. KYL-1]
MKICMLTTVHPPFDSRIFHKESKSLSKAGHRVTIVAPSDSKTRKEVDGINIITVKRPASKVLHPLTMFHVFVEGLKQDYDVYHCHEPGSLLVCSLLKIIKKNKLIYDAHEHYPEMIAENSVFPDLLRGPVFITCNLGEKFLSKYIVNSIITVDDILEVKFRKINKNVYVLSNYPRVELFEEPDAKADNGFKKNIIYVGGLTKIRGTLESIIAFEKAIEKIPDAKLIFIGGFIHPEYEKEVMDYYHIHKLEEKVIFVGNVPHNEVSKYMEKASVAIGLLQPNPRYELAIPVKLFEYMAAGKAVIMSNFRYNSDLIKEVKCGITVDPTDTQEIADAMTWLLEHTEEAKQMGQNGRQAVEKKYSWENMEKTLLLLYEKL